MSEKKDTTTPEKNLNKKAQETQAVTAQNKLATKIQTYVNENRNKVMYISAGVVVLCILIFVGKSYLTKSQEENDNKANVALSRIVPYYQMSDFQRSLNGDSTRLVRDNQVIGLIAIVGQYKSSPSGKIAALYAGNCYVGLNNPEEAATYFDIASESDSKEIQAGAYAGIGIANELMNKNDEAANAYLKASGLAITDEARSRYKLFAGLCYENAGVKEKAEKIYREVIAEFELSEVASNAKSGLIRLGMIIE